MTQPPPKEIREPFPCVAFVFYTVDARERGDAHREARARLLEEYPGRTFKTFDIKRVYRRSGSDLTRYKVTFREETPNRRTP